MGTWVEALHFDLSLHKTHLSTHRYSVLYAACRQSDEVISLAASRIAHAATQPRRHASLGL